MMVSLRGQLRGLVVCLFLFVVFFSCFSFAVTLQPITKNTAKVFAVSETTDRALTGMLTLEIKPGHGSIFFGSSAEQQTFFVPDTQKSFFDAFRAAKKIIGNVVENYDYTFSLDIGATSVEGPSAGSVAAALIVLTLEGKPFPVDDVGITGTINSHGFVGPVGGVFQKIVRAGEEGYKLFLIPTGGSLQIVESEEGVELVDVADYSMENWGMKVVEVSKLDEILDLLFMDIKDINISKSSKTKLVFIPEIIKKEPYMDVFKVIAETYKEFIEKRIDSLKTRKDNLTDRKLRSRITRHLKVADFFLSRSDIYLKNNYFYTAANNFFLVDVSAFTHGGIRYLEYLIENPGIDKNLNLIFEKAIEVEQNILERVNEMDKISSRDPEIYISAKQRLVQALAKIKAVKQDINVKDPDSLLSDIATAEGWLYITTLLAPEPGDIPEPENMKNLAENKLHSVELTLKNLGELENLENINTKLNAAKEALNLKWYATSYLVSLNLGATIEDLTQKEINSEDVFSDYNSLRESLEEKDFVPLWAELFLDHAYFYLQRFERENNIADLKSSYSLIKLSKAHLDFEEALNKEVSLRSKGRFVEIPAPGEEKTIPKVVEKPGEKTPEEKKMTIKTEVKKNNILKYTLIAIIVLLIAFLGYFLVFSKPRPSLFGKRREVEGKIDRLQDAYSQGKITKSKFNTLRGKLQNTLERLDSAISKMLLKRNILDRIEYEERKKQLFILEKKLDDLIKSYKEGNISRTFFTRNYGNLRRNIFRTRRRLYSITQAPYKAGRKGPSFLDKILKFFKI